MRFYHPVPGGSATPSAPRARAGASTRASTSRSPTARRIEAAGVGTVVFAGYNTGGYGNLVVVQHRLGYSTWYAHMSRIATYAGRRRRRHDARLRRLDRALDRPAPALRGAHQQRPGQPGALPAGGGTAARVASGGGASCDRSKAALRRPERLPQTARIDDCRRASPAASRREPRAIARRSSALSSVASSTPFSIATSRIVRLEATASLTISVPRS